MAGVLDRLAFVVTANVDNAVKEFGRLSDSAGKEADQAESKLTKFSGTATKWGAAMVAAGGVGLVALKGLADAASAVGEQVNRAGVIFGEAAGQVEEFAESAAEIGLSKRAALEAAGAFGTLFKSIGVSNTQSAEWSVTLSKLAADLASINDTSIDEAIMAIGSGLRGEAEPLRKFGILLDDATLKAKAMEMGIYEGTGTLTNAQKVQAAYNVILTQGAYAQDDFVNTSDGLANSQRKLSANLENLQSAIGEGLIPVFATLTGAAGSALDMFNGLPAPIKEALGALAGWGAIGAIVAGGTLMMVGQVAKLIQSYQMLRLSSSGAMRALGAAGPYAAAAVAAAALAPVLIDLAGKYSGLSIEIKNLTGFTKENVGETVKAIERLAVFGDDALGGFIDKLRDMGPEGVGALQALREEYERLGDDAAAGRITDAIGRAVDAQKAQNEASKAGAEALNKQEDATEGVTRANDDFLKSIQAAADAVLGAADANINYEQKQQDTAEAIDLVRKGSDDQAKAIRDAKSAMLDQAEAAAELAKQQALKNGQSWTDVQASQAQAAELRNLAGTMAPGSPLRTWLEQLANDMDYTFRNRAVTIDINASAARAYETWNDFMGLIGGNSSGPVRRYSGGPVPGAPGQARAAILHGGEYVLSADVVDAINRGAPSRGLGGRPSGGDGGSMGGVTVIVNTVAGNSQEIARMVVSGLAEAKRTGLTTITV